MSIGPYFTMRASARITPAGVISAGITTAAILVAVGYLISSTKGRRPLKRWDGFIPKSSR
jgi:hypothetical protein